MDMWGSSSDVILVDAVVSDRPARHGDCFRCHHSPLPVDQFATSSHSIGIAEAVEFARILGLMPARLRIYGIESKQFAEGSDPSPEVLKAVEEAAEMIVREVSN